MQALSDRLGRIAVLADHRPLPSLEQLANSVRHASASGPSIALSAKSLV